jgi:predicted dehydrogenase
VAIATPPAAQAEIVAAALAIGLPVFAEKPLALDLDQAVSLAAATGPLANVIDFNFCEIDAFRAAREGLHHGTVGRLRHVCVTWHVESYANRAGLVTWKTDNSAGGGALFNFVTHSLDYLEWFIGPVRGLFARLAGMPNDARRNDSFVAMALHFGCGAAGSLTMSAAAYQGSGHRIEFYGEDGTIVLNNVGPDYMRGFSLAAARRPEQTLTPVKVQTPDRDRWADGRVLPSSRVAKRFLDWVTEGLAAEPSFARGLRAQYLADAASRSHRTGRWIDTAAVGG